MKVNQSDAAQNSSNWRHWFDDDFEISFFSSNNRKYYKTIGGYFLCQESNSTENYLVPTNFTDGNLDAICGNKTIFIPNSPSDLAQATNSLKSFKPARR